MKRVKLIHEDLNAGGGAERLAAASLETLKELDFSVDLVTFTKPNWNELERIFGISKLRNFVNNVIKADINSLLGDDSSVQSDNNEYDIPMHPHRHILPSTMLAAGRQMPITYCHYPLAQELIHNLKYDT